MNSEYKTPPPPDPNTRARVLDYIYIWHQDYFEMSFLELQK